MFAMYVAMYASVARVGLHEDSGNSGLRMVPIYDVCTTLFREIDERVARALKAKLSLPTTLEDHLPLNVARARHVANTLSPRSLSVPLVKTQCCGTHPCGPTVD